ncbi:MAG: RpiB/LacA/LacB family sugar-phosphate isomerase [Candidatus Paceibacterota bacterium]|nr:MAG: RpiB/LacA/LacB family sugar-phosphate isomerase [Candidatus Paceibacterota bacterium]
MLYLIADHRGFLLKDAIAAWLHKQGIAFEDLGAHALDKDDDYPDFAILAREKAGKDDRIIALCGTGVGMDIALNRAPHIRCGLPRSLEHVREMRTDDDVNALALGADSMTQEEAFAYIQAFLDTPFSGDARHVRRIAKLS